MKVPMSGPMAFHAYLFNYQDMCNKHGGETILSMGWCEAFKEIQHLKFFFYIQIVILLENVMLSPSSWKYS